MTDTRPRHYAVKYDEDPVEIRSGSAHDRLPWVGRGYDICSVPSGCKLLPTSKIALLSVDEMGTLEIEVFND